MMKKILFALVIILAAVIVAFYVLPLESIPRSVGWHHYVIISLFYGSAVSTIFLMKYTNFVWRLFGGLYTCIMVLMGTLHLWDLVQMLTQNGRGLR